MDRVKARKQGDTILVTLAKEFTTIESKLDD